MFHLRNFICYGKDIIKEEDNEKEPKKFNVKKGDIVKLLSKEITLGG
jgi:hypothetical protein